jgi:hypothetical protein
MTCYYMWLNDGLLLGSGLGKAGQGRLEPVGLSTQRGRRGLGLVLQASNKT